MSSSPTCWANTPVSVSACGYPTAGCPGDLGEDGYLSTLWLLAPDSWASVADTVVRQAGVRRLWDEVISAYCWWQQSGRSSRDRYGVTVTAQGQAVWLDDPTRPVTTPSQ